MLCALHTQVKFKDLLKLNAPDWHLVTTGIIMSTAVGCLFPLMSILFSEMLEVCVSVCVCVRACVCACVCVWVWVGGWVWVCGCEILTSSTDIWIRQ